MGQKILYLECNSGISGDMTVGALLDLGADRSFLEESLKALRLDGFRTEIHRAAKCGLDACKFDVILTDGEGETHHHEHHSHGHAHGEEGHRHPGHVHRTLQDILEMLREADLDERVRTLAEKIFYILAKAEGKVHGKAPEQVHFHEVGAVDSIVDIVGAAACLVSLGVTEAAVSTLREGCGTVLCQHGEMPVPVPAVAELAAQHGLPLELTETKGEMITPTGAAIAAAVRTREALPKQFRILGCGYGAGCKDFAHANVLRAMLVEEEEEAGETSLWMLETNVDDCSGEQLGLLEERLLGLGARDVWFCPIYMKKCRPAYMIQVLCTADVLEKAQDLLFEESTTIGVRFYPVERRVLERRIERIETSVGELRFKICARSGETAVYPEYEDIREICRKTGKSYREIYETAKRDAGQKLAAGRKEESRS